MEYIMMIYMYIIGTIFGSFFNVCIFRIPNNQSISNPPSHCYNCNNRLKPLDLVPILSWVFLKGRCRYCGEKISPRYALVELLTGVLFVLVYNVYGLNIITLYYLILVSLLVVITFIDIDHYIIPNGLIIFGSIFGVLFSLMGQGIELKDSILGAIISGGGMFLLIYLIELIVKKEVMGGGDIKLFAMIGLFLGVEGGLLTILLSIYVGAIYGVGIILYSKAKKKDYNSVIPYGPFISVGSIIVILYGDNIINWYLNMFS
ncbi:prepilin peptidase [Romboutsia weinsteinii]|uniref:Prepilin leader peptidase/N-methyltransferase n=1 Tax=Romboutsia weinsteinii TaxID=2020949 RepID=A0A371J1G9_9FIRM|nr:A24 family peptidase [Romboutsia weinsteinii]RDY26651.1 prepilin peptidase [Romboutsia weinsteinii]